MSNDLYICSNKQCIIQIDFKRVKNWKTKYFFFGNLKCLKILNIICQKIKFTSSMYDTSLEVLKICEDSEDYEMFN